MERFIKRPSIDMYPGIRVSKETRLEYDAENVHQTLENLEFHSATKMVGEEFESTYDTTIHLKEGDILIFEEEGRGYIKPVEKFATVKETIEELSCIKDL